MPADGQGSDGSNSDGDDDVGILIHVMWLK